MDSDHTFPYWQWIHALAETWPEDYAEPPPPPAPILSIDSETRVRIMAWRYVNGFAIRHPFDDDPAKLMSLARQVGRRSNGSVEEFATTIERCHNVQSRFDAQTSARHA